MGNEFKGQAAHSAEHFGDTRVIGVDREPRWVAQASARALTAVFPPYSTVAQRAFIDDARDRANRRLWIWSEADARRFFLAGGGNEEAFDVHFARALASREKIARGLNEATYHGIVGGEFYLVAGRKPGANYGPTHRDM